MPIVEYRKGEPFPGVVGRTAEESTPAWPALERAKRGAPNVLFVVLDDTGFGQLGCYGSPIETPSFDRLATGGVRYTNMHTTALCSPSRSCVVTGRNHHANGMACITELASGYPGYDGVMPFENGLLSEMLVEQGYNTFMVGKWHLTPSHEETAAGPYTRWPLGRGFERFYGFLGGDTSQWYPDLVYDNHQVEPPRTPEEGYHLTEDLVDKSIEFIADSRQVDPDKPFYLHLCFGATHAPHHVPKEWADRYAGMFDQGWDAYREQVFARQKELAIVPADAELSRHDPDVPDWDALPAPARKLYSRMMEVFAGFLSHTDHHLGRLLDFLDGEGLLDNTLVMVISDNGASSEGGPTGTTNEAQFFNNAPEPLEDSLKVIDEIGGPNHFNHYPWGWTFAGNTPFRRWKRETYRGGVSDPFIVHWPKGMAARGEVRTQYAHAIDMVPTALEAIGLAPPSAIRGVTQAPLHGVSLAHTFDDADAPSRRTTQYFEMLGHRSIYKDGWRAVCPWPGPSFAEAGIGFGEAISAETLVAARRDRLGALPRRRGLRREPRRRRGASRQADRADRLLVRRGRQVRRAADRRQRARADGGREADGGGAPRPLHLPLGHAVGPVLRRAAGAQPAAQHHGGGRDPRGRRRGRRALPGHRGRRLLALPQGRQAALRPQLRRPRPLRRPLRERDHAGQARAPVRVRADRPARPGGRQGNAGQLPALRRRRARRGGRGAGHDTVHDQSRPADLRRQSRLAGHTRTTPRRSPSPARSTTSRSTSAAS